MQRGGTSGTGIVHVDDAGIAQPGLAEEGLAPDASLVEQSAGRGVAEDDQVDPGRLDTCVCQRVGYHLVGHVDRGTVPSVHGGGGRPHDAHGTVHRRQPTAPSERRPCPPSTGRS